MRIRRNRNDLYNRVWMRGINMAARVFDVLLGDELVTNGDFATDTVWVKGAPWIIAGGVASCDGTQIAVANLTQTVAINSAKTYQLKYEVVTITAGTIRGLVGGVGGVVTSTVGEVTEQIAAGGSTDLTLQANIDFVGSITNVSLQEVLNP